MPNQSTTLHFHFAFCVLVIIHQMKYSYTRLQHLIQPTININNNILVTCVCVFDECDGILMTKGHSDLNPNEC